MSDALNAAEEPAGESPSFEFATDVPWLAARGELWSDIEWAFLKAVGRSAPDGIDNVEGWLAVDGATWAVSDVNGLTSREYSTPIELAGVWSPIFEAFEAGLFVYWITPCEVICVLQPSLSLEDGRLHSADGPAVSWPSGEQYFFWRGVQVPAWVIEEPIRITPEAIHVEPDDEVRRCLREISEHFRQQGP